MLAMETQEAPPNCLVVEPSDELGVPESQVVDHLGQAGVEAVGGWVWRHGCPHRGLGWNVVRGDEREQGVPRRGRGRACERRPARGSRHLLKLPFPQEA